MSLRSSIFSTISIIIFSIVLGSILYNLKFTLSTDKSIDINAPVTISAGETIDITVSRGKGDWMVYVYFDDDKENKIKLDSNFFSFKGSVTAPFKKGIHSLTIEVSIFEKQTYYYLVE